MATDKFNGRKPKWFLIGTGILALLAIILSPMLANPASAQSTTIVTLEQIEKVVQEVVEDLLNPLVQKVDYLTEKVDYLTEKEELSVSQDQNQGGAEQTQAQVETQTTVLAVPQPREAEVVKTIIQVGGGKEIIRNYNVQNEAKMVKLPMLIEDLGWQDIHRGENGQPLYLVALSSDEGNTSFAGQPYFFDKGYVAVFQTDEVESIAHVTEWNNSDPVISAQHYNIWAEMYVVSTAVDMDEMAKRLLSEWIQTQGKDLGFTVFSDGSVEKMKYTEAVDFNLANAPLFPKQLNEGAIPIIMTPTQVGAGGEVMVNWKEQDAVVYIDIEDLGWKGILRVDDKPVYVVLLSSDSGDVVVGSKKKTFDQGFVSAIVTTDPQEINVSTGWNESNGNHNVWSEVFILPDDEDVDEFLKSKLTSWKKSHGKAYAYALLLNGEEFMQ